MVDWGGRQIVDELAPDGSLVLRLTVAAPYYSYRAFPILPGQLRPAQVIAGMDKMYPRPHPTLRRAPQKHQPIRRR